MTLMHLRVLELFVVLICLGTAGCGSGDPVVEPTMTLTGKLLKGGQPLTVNKAEFGDYAHVQVHLIPTVEGMGQGYSGVCAEDGSFEMKVYEGDEIQPGRYRVAVHQWNPAPDKDMLQGKFSAANTKLEVEITSPGESLIIDLDGASGG